jgi:hypothetical protein
VPQVLEQILERTARTLRVGVRHGRPGDWPGAKVIEVWSLAVEPCDHLAQAVGAGELTIRHGGKLGFGGERAHVLVGVMALDVGLEMRTADLAQKPV